MAMTGGAVEAMALVQLTTAAACTADSCACLVYSFVPPIVALGSSGAPAADASSPEVVASSASEMDAFAFASADSCGCSSSPPDSGGEACHCYHRDWKRPRSDQ